MGWCAFCEVGDGGGFLLHGGGWGRIFGGYVAHLVEDYVCVLGRIREA